MTRLCRPILIASVALLFGCAAGHTASADATGGVGKGKNMAQGQLHPLNDAEILKLLVGKTLRFREMPGQPTVAGYAEHYRENGAAAVQLDRVSRQSRYTVRGGILCLRIADEPGPKCRNLYRDALGNIYQREVGSEEHTLISIEIV